MAGISDMSTWMLIVPAGGRPFKYVIEQTPTSAQYVHITNIALGLNPSKDPHTLTISTNDQEVVVARLTRDHLPQQKTDFILDQTVQFRNHGPTDLHLLGYQTVSDYRSEGGEDSDDEGMDFDTEDEDEDEDEDEEAPDAVPLMNGNKGAPAKLASKDQKTIDVKRAAAGGKTMMDRMLAMVRQGGDLDEDEDDDEEGESGEDEELPQLGSDDEVMEFDEGEDEDEDEDEEGDEGDEEEEEEEEQPPAKVSKAGDKRPQPGSLTPAPAKKTKAEAAKVPMSAPPKQQAAAGKQADKSKAAAQPTTPAAAGAKTTIVKPANEAEFEKAIIDFLKSKPDKSAPLSQLGSAVHRPDGVPKLAAWLKTKANKFKVDPNGQNVKLA